MKWREPWRETLRRQAPLRLLSRQQLWRGLIWTLAFVALCGFSVVLGYASLGEAVSRSGMAPVYGFGIAGLLAALHWLSPLEISSGPRGIVRSKGEVSGLIPWETIRAYRFLGAGAGRVLELDVSYAAEPERLYLAAKVDVAEVEAEIRTHIHAGLSVRSPGIASPTGFSRLPLP